MRGALVSRRRLLHITAAVAGAGLLPVAAAALPAALVWRGSALGAAATVTLYHPDRAAARDLLAQAMAEVRRLEGVFSLYQADSAISRLNRDGRLAVPPLELVELLGQARTISELTGGGFDATVQPLWRLYAEHFAAQPTDGTGPDRTTIEQALELVDYRALQVSAESIGFARPGMAITLNGIAQGYITDRIAALLRRGGLEQVLIDLGEIRALGRHPDGRRWTAGIASPDGSGALLQELALEDSALATSAGSGTRFEPGGRYHHLFDPQSGESAARHASVSVLAPTATLADGLSTGFSAMSLEEIDAICRALPGVTAITLAADGRLHGLGTASGA